MIEMLIDRLGEIRRTAPIHAIFQVLLGVATILALVFVAISVAWTLRNQAYHDEIGTSQQKDRARANFFWPEALGDCHARIISSTTNSCQTIISGVTCLVVHLPSLWLRGSAGGCRGEEFSQHSSTLRSPYPAPRKLCVLLLLLCPYKERP
jgi:hypothetical protein